MVELNYLDITKTGEGHIKVPAKGVVAPAITESIAKSALASFADGADGWPLKSLTGYINPVQSGSGNPSPSNVRPITGWTGMNVYRTGKNLCSVTNITNCGWATSITDVKDLLNTLPAGAYALSMRFTVTSVIDASPNWVWGVRFDNPVENITKQKNYGGSKTVGATERYTTTFNITSSQVGTFTKAYFYGFGNSTSGVTARSNIDQMQIEIIESGGSATDYEPYGTTYPITWSDTAGTVYGGTLDVTNGKLIATAEYKAMTGNLFVGFVGSTVKRAYTGTGYDNVSILMCDSLTVDDDYDTVNHIGKQSAGARIFVSPSWAQSCEDLTQFKSALANNPINAIVTLATPIEYDIDPETLFTLLGTNNIWADTGDVELTYIADTKKYIDKVLNA